MAELRPCPFAVLVRRLFHDLSVGESVFDLPQRKFFLDPGTRDFGVSMHGHRASSALGPAAGPQTQMAQNLVLSWLGGCRILELKTVQINDTLVLPRPCIDMQTVGYNVEWSQELRLQESLEEYVKGAMLIEMMQASGKLPVGSNYRDMIYDMSVGYDLAGIQSPTVDAFINGMMDCSSLVDSLRSQIPDEFKAYRDLDFATNLSDTLTLSTFHGCPPDEIEKIMAYLLTEKGLHAIVKLNPTLLGQSRVEEILHDRLGYTDIRVPQSAFANDTKWEQAVGFVERLGDVAQSAGRGFGVKFSNTLLVDNHRDFFPREEKAMYLSGPPLHILAMNLVDKFRDTFGDRFPISFSAGIDRNNFADAVAIGLAPVTVCSDLLKPGGYGRCGGYLEVLGQRMDKVGAESIPMYILKAYGLAADALSATPMSPEQQAACRAALESGESLQTAAGEHFEGWLSATKLANSKHYVETCNGDARYSLAKNSKVPKKVGTALELFDCVSCNKCIPVCPNDANFAFSIPRSETPIVKVHEVAGGWQFREDGVLTIAKKAQYGNFADFCNECGNCDIFCPEDGGPYVVKSRFFGSFADWREMKALDGFYWNAAEQKIHGRVAGAEFSVQEGGPQTHFRGAGFDVQFLVEGGVVRESFRGSADSEIDLSFFHILSWVRDALLSEQSNNYLRFYSSTEIAK